MYIYNYATINLERAYNLNGVGFDGFLYPIDVRNDFVVEPWSFHAVFRTCNAPIRHTNQ